MHEQTLIELGLSDKEAAMYEALLKKGQAQIPELVESTGFKRGDTYNILAGLEAWGLLEIKQKDGKKYYSPAHPSKLKEAAAEQVKELENTKKALDGAIPDLLSMYNLAVNKPGVRFFEGKTGIKEALWDSLTAKETIYTYMDRQSMLKVIGDINEEYYRKRLAGAVKKRLLLVDDAAGRDYFAKLPATALSEVALLPKEIRPFRASMHTYDNKLVYFTHRNDNALAVIISDPDLYAMNRSIFEIIWRLCSRRQGPQQKTSPAAGANLSGQTISGQIIARPPSPGSSATVLSG